MPQLLAGVLELAPQTPVPPSFMQTITKPWHCGVLTSPAQGSVKTILCQALVASLSLSLYLVQSQWSGRWQGSCWARGEWEILSHCPAENRRVKSAPAPKWYMLFLTLRDPYLQGLADLLHTQCVLDEFDTELEGRQEEGGQREEHTLPPPSHNSTTLSIP